MFKNLKLSIASTFIVLSLLISSTFPVFAASKKTYYYNSRGEKISTPTTDQRSGATAKCKDGTFSYSKTRKGTCSGHKGVSIWY